MSRPISSRMRTMLRKTDAPDGFAESNTNRTAKALEARGLVEHIRSRDAEQAAKDRLLLQFRWRITEAGRAALASRS